MIRLYYAPQTRAIRPRWLLEELEVPYELVRLNLQEREHKRPEYLAIHPHGVVPALVDGDLVLMESLGICLYLADKFPEKCLAPAAGTTERGLYYQWMAYSVATLEPPLIQIFQHSTMLPEAQRSPQELQRGKEMFSEIAAVLSGALQGRSYLLGQQFTAADVMIGSTLVWASLMGLLQSHPVLDEYVQRLQARGAFQRAIAD